MTKAEQAVITAALAWKQASDKADKRMTSENMANLYRATAALRVATKKLQEERA